MGGAGGVTRGIEKLAMRSASDLGAGSKMAAVSEANTSAGLTTGEFESSGVPIEAGVSTEPGENRDGYSTLDGTDIKESAGETSIFRMGVCSRWVC